MSDADILRLLLIVIGMFLMPFISKRLSISSAVGEIIYGIIVKNTIPLSWHNSNIVSFLSMLGFIVLMYMAGLELDIKTLRYITKKDAISFVLYFLLLMGLAFLASKTLKQTPIFSLVYFVTSIGLLYPVLKELNLVNKPFGLKVLMLGSLGEIISLFSIILFSLYFKFGFSGQIFVKLLQLSVFVVLSVLFLKLLQVFLWWFPHLSEVFLKTGNTTETGIRTNFLNLTLFVFLSSILGIEPILGAFISGLILSLSLPENKNIKSSFAIIGNGFLVPFFFINVGLTFDFGVLASLSVLENALLTIIVISALRYVAMPVLFLSDFSIKESFKAPLGISFPLTLLVAVSEFGQSVGVLNSEYASMLILSAMLGSLVYPTIFRALFLTRHLNS